MERKLRKYRFIVEQNWFAKKYGVTYFSSSFGEEEYP